MDLISVCEKNGYSLVASQGEISIFENENNYLMIDTTQTVETDATNNKIQSEHINFDVSNDKGYITVDLDLPESLPHDTYTKMLHIANNDNPTDGYRCLLTLNVTDDLDRDMSYETYDTTKLPYDTLTINVQAGDKISFDFPYKYGITTEKNIGVFDDGHSLSNILPEKLENEKTRLLDYVRHPNSRDKLAKTVNPDHDDDPLSKEDIDLYVNVLESNIELINEITTETQIFFYNKHSGKIIHDSVVSATGTDGSTYFLERKHSGDTLTSLDKLPSFLSEASQVESAKRILSVMDDYCIDIHQQSYAGEVAQLFRESFGEKISYDEIKPGMVLAQHKDISTDVFEVYQVLDVTKESRTRRIEKEEFSVVKRSEGFYIFFNGDKDSSSLVEVDKPQFKNLDNQKVLPYNQVYLMDPSILSANERVDEILKCEDEMYKLDADKQLEHLTKSVKEEICDDRSITSLWL